MEEVCSGVKDRAEEIYKSYIESGLKETPSFKGVGKAYIRFASERPQLFRLLFMRENGEIPSLDSVLGKIDGNFAKILNSITANYPVGSETALNIYKHLWIYSHGIAVLTVTKVCAFGENEISEMLTEVFKSLLKNSIGEKND